ncbi:MAG TPA: glucokinase [Thermoanaerobaculia bacterium]|nr:glucokinase [Thermoanaerobaculia bacterium]
MRVIAGDIGGTKTLFQFIDDNGVTIEQRYESGAHAAFEDMLRDFTARSPHRADAACFAVAGPVVERIASVTNLHWQIDADKLEQTFAIAHVALINDFEAVALGVPLLADNDVVPLQLGTREAKGPIGIVGAGTGLGEAMVMHDGARWNVIASEGGHGDFAPQDQEQTRLFAGLHEKLGHVSWERLVSGMGLVNIHNFVTGVEREYDDVIPAEIAAAYARGDEAARNTVRIFIDIYGSEAGNMALRVLARGGVFLAGGIAARNLEWFTDGRFIEAFLRKGRFQQMLRNIPVNLIANPRVGLIGATEMARRISA